MDEKQQRLARDAKTAAREVSNSLRALNDAICKAAKLGLQVDVAVAPNRYIVGNTYYPDITARVLQPL